MTPYGSHNYYTKIFNIKEEQMENNYKEGDVLVDGDGNERTVLGVCGKVYLMSVVNDPESYFAGFTIQSLNASHLKGSTTEISMDEIASKFGVDVKNLKIRKEE